MKNILSEYHFDSIKQFLRKMRTTSLMLILSISSLFATNVKSQITKVSFTVQNASISDVIEKIESQTDYLFVYNKNEIDLNRKVNIRANKQSVAEILSDIFNNTNIVYAKEGTNIMLMQKSVSQQQKITGTVTGKDGTPIPGANVVVSGTTNGTMTDIAGKYSIDIPMGSKSLKFSFIGMDSQEISIGTLTQINVTMAESAVGLEEVVIVGYGTQKKINITGSIDVVSGDALANRSAPNVSELMEGISPNLNIVMSNHGGEPGSVPSWNIRGLGSNSGSDPLILIDGVEGDVNNLDPESIESVSVLKDASASAIYGARAPFGVVLITTKKGQKNKGIKIQYNYNKAWASPIRVPEFVDAFTWATAFNQSAANSGVAPIYSAEQVERIKGYMAGTYKNEYDINNPPQGMWRSRWLGNANYNWPKLFYKENSPSSKQNINLEGGDNKTQYYVSGGYYNQGGLYNWGDDSYKRYNLMANVTSQVTNWLRFDFSTRYAQTSTDYPLGIVGTPRDYNLREFMTFGPMTPMFLADGVTIINPIVRALQSGGRNKSTNNDLWLKLGTEIEPIKGWKTNIAYNYNLGSSSNSQNPIPVPVIIPNGTIGNIGTSSSGDIENMSSTNYYIFNALTSYEKNISDHFLKAMIGYEQELNNDLSLYGSRMDLISVFVPSINAAVGESTLGANSDHWSTQAVFGRFNYNFKEKYLLEFSSRYNGSSRFAVGSRWGFFPSLSGGYNISKEAFWESIEPYVNTFKLRGSYGSLGNQNVSNYLYLSNIPTYSNLPYIIDNARPIYAQVPNIISSSLTWETVTTLNLGLDVTVLKNRLGLTFDWFRRKTSNMVGPSQDLPAVLGTSAPQENNAELESRGFELSLDWKDRITPDFSYNLKLSIADSKATILKYKNDDKVIDDWYDGKSYGEIWGYKTDGLIQTQGEPMPDQSKFYSTWGPGDMKYKDLDGNNIINDGTRTLNDHGDLTIIGNESPRYNVSISAGFNWKGFSFSMFWQGIGKRDFLPSADANVFYGFSSSGYTESSIDKGPALDYWRPANETNILGPNIDAYFPKPYDTEEELMKNRQDQSRYVLNAAYLRLKNLQIGYTIPKKLSKKVFIETARFYVSGENLITLTKLPRVFDPETCFASDSRMGGLQQTGAVYPISRNLSFGFNLTF